MRLLHADLIIIIRETATRYVTQYCSGELTIGIVLPSVEYRVVAL